MSELVRLYRYRELLSAHRALSARDLQSALEISPATFKRDIAKLRDQLRMPIVFDRDLGGYVMEGGRADSELPGLWFSPQELVALITVQHLASQLAPGVLGPKLAPLQQRMDELLARNGLSGSEVANRIRVVHAGRRKLETAHFASVAMATLARKRVQMVHRNRQTGGTTEREVSPQRMVHYRDNWYVDSYCHLRKQLRSFAVDAIVSVEMLPGRAQEVDAAEVDRQMTASYGIFAGPPQDTAQLRFTPERARWVRREQWHPLQKGWEEADGSYRLEVPYSDDREILADLLRFGPDVEVIGPPALRRRVQTSLLRAIERYVQSPGS